MWRRYRNIRKELKRDGNRTTNTTPNNNTLPYM